MLNGTQVGPSFGSLSTVWRVETDEPGGTRVLPTTAFGVCLSGAGVSAVSIQTLNCLEQTTSDLAATCTCPAGSVAISGGGFSGNQSNLLDSLQVGPALGESAQIWRVGTDQPNGTAVAPTQPFAVCLGSPYASAVRVETSSCATVNGGAGVECTCGPNEVAIAGGASAGAPGNMLNSNLAGPILGGSPQAWRVACVNPSGDPVSCATPFAVCLSL
jgi:hypothetical protein